MKRRRDKRHGHSSRKSKKKIHEIIDLSEGGEPTSVAVPNSNEDSDSDEEANECPYCFEHLVSPKTSSKIFQCPKGHLMCGECKPKFNICPTCNEEMGTIRNRALEKLLSKKTRTAERRVTEAHSRTHCACPNAKEGCTFRVHSSKRSELEKHKNECMYQRCQCWFEDCAEQPLIKDMAQHLEVFHKTASSTTTNEMTGPIRHICEHAVKFPQITPKGGHMWPKLMHILTPIKSKPGGAKEKSSLLLFADRSYAGTVSIIVRALLPPGRCERDSYKIMIKSGKNKLVWTSTLYSIVRHRQYEKDKEVRLVLGKELVERFLQKTNSNSNTLTYSIQWWKN